MVKIIGVSLIAAAMALGSPVFAKDKSDDMACCAKNASNQKACVSLASLSLTADQKSKIEAWHSECMKAGCTKESRQAFLKKAQGVLSADQFAKLKAECSKSGKKV